MWQYDENDDCDGNNDCYHAYRYEFGPKYKYVGINSYIEHDACFDIATNLYERDLRVNYNNIGSVIEHMEETAQHLKYLTFCNACIYGDLETVQKMTSENADAIPSPLTREIYKDHIYTDRGGIIKLFNDVCYNNHWHVAKFLWDKEETIRNKYKWNEEENRPERIPR